VLGGVHAFSQAVHAANIYRPKFQVGARLPNAHIWTGCLPLAICMTEEVQYTENTGGERLGGGQDTGKSLSNMFAGKWALEQVLVSLKLKKIIDAEVC